VFDVQTHRISQLTGSQGVFGPRWSPDGRYLVGISSDGHELALFDVKSQKWRQLFHTNFIGYLAWSADSRYIYFDTLFEKEPAYHRLRVSDAKLETVVDLKRLRTFPSQFGPGSWTGLAPGDIPLFVRDNSVQEIYALDLRLP
jgi:Tol biopolymer transport system component